MFSSDLVLRVVLWETDVAENLHITKWWFIERGIIRLNASCDNLIVIHVIVQLNVIVNRDVDGQVRASGQMYNVKVYLLSI